MSFCREINPSVSASYFRINSFTRWLAERINSVLFESSLFSPLSVCFAFCLTLLYYPVSMVTGDGTLCMQFSDTVLRVLCVFDTTVVQLTLVSQSQSALQENKLRGLRIGLEKLNQSYQLLFSQYPALNQYCPISNATTGGESGCFFIQSYKC